MKKSIIILAALFFTASCTENSRAKNWGGTEKMELKPNEVLINMTWKADDMWVQTLDTTTGLQYFREHSSYGVWEGEIIIYPANDKVNIEGSQFKR